MEGGGRAKAGIRVLCLDGGGIRGLLQIEILSQVRVQVDGHEEGSAKAEHINSVPTKRHIIYRDKCLVHIIIAWKVMLPRACSWDGKFYNRVSSPEGTSQKKWSYTQ